MRRDVGIPLGSPKSPSNGRRSLWIVTLLLSSTITLTNQVWVGRMSIYSAAQETRREQMHEAILANTPPGGGTWDAVGANGFNIRLLTVWAAEGLRRVDGQTIGRNYFLIETLGVFASCLLLFWFLESCVGGAFAFAGLLYFGSVLPLTYVLHYFHPWDKPSLATWLLALLCTWHRRWLWLGLVLLIGMAIKYDIVLFPIFVFLVEYRRADWWRAVLISAPLAAANLAAYVFLRWLAPGGAETRHWSALAADNLQDFWRYGLGHGPLLAIGPLIALAALGYSSSDSYAKAAVQFAGMMLLVLFLQTHFREFRAEMPLLALLMPAAAFGIARLSSSWWPEPMAPGTQ
jgi:hypothetical protein